VVLSLELLWGQFSSFSPVGWSFSGSVFFRLLRRAVSRVCLRGVLSKAEMEHRFSVEAKAFYFLVKAEVSEIRLEERRKGFCGYIFLDL
jgi:hypothetical protein